MISRSALICQRGRTVMRNAGSPDFTDNLKESGSFEPVGHEPVRLGGLIGRPSHTSARSAGIAQRAKSNSGRHILNRFFTGRATEKKRLNGIIAIAALKFSKQLRLRRSIRWFPNGPLLNRPVALLLALG